MEETLNALIEAQPDYKLAQSYYLGNREEIFASDWFQRNLAKADFTVNFTNTVVDAVLNRLELAGVTATSDRGQALVDTTWGSNELMLTSNDVHKSALMFGDCYLIVWPGEEDLRIAYNSPLTTRIAYDPEDGRRKLHAVKLWRPNRDTFRLNVYYPDHISKKQGKGSTVRAVNWNTIEEVENPYGEVPVFHFRTERPYGSPEHRPAYGSQDAINKLVAVQMTTVDYQGAPQRYALANPEGSTEIEDFNEDATARENSAALKNGPGEVWFLQGISHVGQFQPADPQAFIQPMREFVRHIATSTSTPFHYFERAANIPSGEALRVAEAPLTKKVEDRKLSFGAAWRETFKFVLRTEGVQDDVQVKWQSKESIDTVDHWNVALMKKNAGVPFEQIMREAGYDDKLISQWETIAKEITAPDGQ